MLPSPDAPAPGMETLRWPHQPGAWRPDYARCLTGVYPTLFELLGRPAAGYPSLVDWLPAGVPRSAKHVLLLCLDGLGFKELALSGRLAALYPEYGTWITSVFPSITSCAMTSLYQALPPARHGLLGHLVWKDFPGAVVDLLRTRVVGAPVALQDAGFDVQRWKREPGILDGTTGDDLPGFQLMDQFIVRSGLSTLIYGDSTRVGFADLLEGFVKAGRLLTGMPRGWVSLYLPQVDTLSHVLTGEAPEVGLVLAHIEAALARLAASLPRAVREETVLMVVADHGQNTIRERLALQGDELAWLEAHSRAIGGSGRVLHVYLDAGQEAPVLPWMRELVGERGRVYRYEEIKVLTGPEALFSGNGAALRADDAWVRQSLGDLVAVLNDGWNWDRPNPYRTHGPYDSPLVSQHGGLSWDEMFVPILCAPMSALLPG